MAPPRRHPPRVVPRRGRKRTLRAVKPPPAKRHRDDYPDGLELNGTNPHAGQAQKTRECSGDAHRGHSFRLGLNNPEGRTSSASPSPPPAATQPLTPGAKPRYPSLQRDGGSLSPAGRPQAERAALDRIPTPQLPRPQTPPTRRQPKNGFTKPKTSPAAPASTDPHSCRKSSDFGDRPVAEVEGHRGMVRGVASPCGTSRSRGIPLDLDAVSRGPPLGDDESGISRPGRAR